MTPRKAPEAVLVALAEAVDKWARASEYFDGDNEVSNMLRAYRAAVAPLRTETEVVLDIGHHVRACMRLGRLMMTADEKHKLEDLANEHTAPRSEPTADETEAVRSCAHCGVAAGNGVVLTFQSLGDQKWYCTKGGCSDETEPTTTDHGADLRDPEPCERCGCEQVEELETRLRRIREIAAP